jgi:ribose/xylose/arabinose/galactoside ABC-type transport system permease subunit
MPHTPLTEAGPSAATTGSAVPPQVRQPRERPVLRALGRFLERYGVLLTFVAVVAVFSLLDTQNFPTSRNLQSILSQTGIVILLAIGLTFVLAAGEFDLSFPAAFGLVSGICVVALSRWHLGPVPTVLVGLGCGIAVGIVNGLLVASRRASSFILTLAAGSAYTGLMYAIAGQAPIIQGVPNGYISIADQHLFGFATVVMLALVLAIAAAIVLRSTVFGRHVQATGSNAEAAGISGVRVNRIRIGAFVVLGIFVAIAAIIDTSTSAAFYPSAGQGLFLPPFVAAFLGTSVLARGQFNVFGTVVGALFISTLQTGLIQQNAPGWVINLVQGVVLALAVMVAAQRARR